MTFRPFKETYIFEKCSLCGANVPLGEIAACGKKECPMVIAGKLKPSVDQQVEKLVDEMKKDGEA